MSTEKVIKKELLIELTSKFCDAYLDYEYFELCKKLINKLSRKRQVPFLKGKIEIWAASIIYSLGQINFLFDNSTLPYVTHDDVCNFFRTKKSTTSQRAKEIRDLFNMTFYDEEFSLLSNIEDSPLKNLKMLNGFIVDERFINERRNLMDVYIEFVLKEDLKDRHYEKNKEKMYDAFIEKLDNMELDYSNNNLKIYTEILNEKLSFPFDVKIIEETELFGETITAYKIHKIYCPSTPKELKKGLLCDCESSGVLTKIPMKDITDIIDENNRTYIEQYKKWLYSVC